MIDDETMPARPFPAPATDALPGHGGALIARIGTDGRTRVVFCDQAFAALTGVACDGVLGVALDDVIASLGDDRISLQLTTGDLEQAGRPTHVLASAFTRDPAAGPARLPAEGDALTGLVQRGRFAERLEQAFARVADDAHLALLFVDVDHFKSVNDSYGHEAGDDVLAEVARRLRGCTRSDDVVARYGGDEFVILLEGPIAADAPEVAERIVTAMRAPILAAGRDLSLSASIGVARAGSEANGPDTLLRNADTALYEAKHRGRGRVHVFNADLHRQQLRRGELESALRRALRDGQLTLVYQPQVALASGRMVGVEALLRWDHPDLGEIGPREFVPVAEEAGLVLPLGLWVLDEALRQFRAWTDARARGLRTITINLSPIQLSDPNIVRDVRAALERHGVEPHALCLDLPERALSRETPQTLDTLQGLRALGVYLGIDDFGTGRSTPAQLRELPVEVIKIDRDFIDGLGREESDSGVVASIMSQAFAMGLHAIAVGVDQPCQALALARLGCTTGQGFLFARPVPADEVAALCGRRLWRSSGAAPSRRARRRFIEEFLEQIGVRMAMDEVG